MTPVSPLTRDTAVTARFGAGSQYDAELGDGWLCGEGILGGLLATLAGRALAQEFATHSAGHTDPLSISAHFLSAATPGPACLWAEVLRRGRSVSTGTVSVTQPDASQGTVTRLRAIGTYGTLARAEERTFAGPPAIPPAEHCLGNDAIHAGQLWEMPRHGRMELRLDPHTAGWLRGRPSGRGLVQGWLRLPAGSECDPLLLLLAADALPPASLDLGPKVISATLEMTAYVWGRPAPGWLRLRRSARRSSGPYLQEDNEVWDTAGCLVAQSRQLARTTAG